MLKSKLRHFPNFGPTRATEKKIALVSGSSNKQTELHV